MSFYPSYKSTGNVFNDNNIISLDDASGLTTISLDTSKLVEKENPVIKDTLYIKTPNTGINFQGDIQLSAFNESLKNDLINNTNDLTSIKYDGLKTILIDNFDLSSCNLLNIKEEHIPQSKIINLETRLQGIDENLSNINNNDTDILDIQTKNQQQDDRIYTNDTTINNHITLYNTYTTQNDIDKTNINLNLVSLQDKNAEQDGKLTDIETNDLEQDGRLTNIETKDLEQDGRLTVNETKDLEQDGRLEINETKNTEQDGRLTDIETKGLEQDGRLTNIETKDLEQDGRLTENETKNTEQDGRLTDIETKDLEQDGRLIVNETKDLEQDGRLTTLELYDSNQTGLNNSNLTRLSNLETQQSTNTTYISLKQNIINDVSKLNCAFVGNGDISNSKLSSLNDIRTDISIQSQLDVMKIELDLFDGSNVVSNTNRISSLESEILTKEDIISDTNKIEISNVENLQSNLNTLTANISSNISNITTTNNNIDTLIAADVIINNQITNLQTSDITLQNNINLKQNIITLLNSDKIFDVLMNDTVDNLLNILDTNISALETTKQTKFTALNKLPSNLINRNDNLQFVDVSSSIQSQIDTINSNITLLQGVDTSVINDIQSNFDQLDSSINTNTTNITNNLNAISTLQSLQNGDITSFNSINTSLSNLQNTKQNTITGVSKLDSNLLNRNDNLQYIDISSSLQNKLNSIDANIVLKNNIIDVNNKLAIDNIDLTGSNLVNMDYGNSMVSKLSLIDTSISSLLSVNTSQLSTNTNFTNSINNLETFDTNQSTLNNGYDTSISNLETFDTNQLTLNTGYNTSITNLETFDTNQLTLNSGYNASITNLTTDFETFETAQISTNTQLQTNIDNIDLSGISINASNIVMNTNNINQNTEDIQYNTSFRENSIFFDYRITTNATNISTNSNAIVDLQTNIDNVKNKIEPFGVTNYDDTINVITHTYDEMNLFIDPLDDNLLLDLNLTIENVSNDNNYKQILYINCLEFKSYVNKILINDIEYEIKHKDSEVINLAPISGYSMIKQEINCNRIGNEWFIMSEVDLYYNSESNTAYDITPPVIILLGNANTTIEINETPYIDAGSTCDDIVDGDISNNIVVSGDTVDYSVLGVYTLYFNITDNAGNIATQRIRVINVVDTINPVVVLVGENEIELIQHATYSESGATVSDNSNETLSITIGGSVNTAVLGDYVVTYTATDSTGNTHQISRLVRVVVTPLVLLWSNPSINIFDYVSVFNNINSSSDKTVYNYTNSGHSDYWVNGAYVIGCSSYRAGPNTPVTSIFGSTLYGGGNELYYENSRGNSTYNDSTLGNIGPRSDMPYDTSGIHVSTTASGHTLYFSTVVSGTTYYGEFIDTTFPFKLKVSKFYMDTIVNYANFIPKQMIICGSNNDGATYDYIATIGDNSTSPLVYDVAVTSSYAYKKIRIICTKSSSRRTFFLQFYKLYGNIYE